MLLPIVVVAGLMLAGGAAKKKPAGATNENTGPGPNQVTFGAKGEQLVRPDLAPALLASLAGYAYTDRGANLIVLDNTRPPTIESAAGWIARKLGEGRVVLINVDGELPGELLAVPQGTETGAAARGARWAVLAAPGSWMPSPPLPTTPSSPLPMPTMPTGTVPASWQPGPQIEPPEWPTQPPSMPSMPPGLPTVPSMPSMPPGLPTVPSMPSMPGMPGTSDPLAGVPEPLRTMAQQLMSNPNATPEQLRALADQLRAQFPALAAALEQQAQAATSAQAAQAAIEGRLFTIRGKNGLAVDLPTSVAKHYTGNANKWREILTENPELVEKTVDKPGGGTMTIVKGWEIGKVVTLPKSWGTLTHKGLPPTVGPPSPDSVKTAAKAELKKRGAGATA